MQALLVNPEPQTAPVVKTTITPFLGTPLLSSQTVQQLLVIDPTVEDYQTLVQGTVEGIQTYILNAAEDGIDQITQILGQHPNLKALHIVCHGAPGTLHLGNTIINRANLTNYSHHLQQWQVQNLVIWACDVGQDPQFLDQLQKLTQTNIAAASQKLGNGHWHLDQKRGEITPQTPFNSITEKTYAGTLANFSIAATFGAGDGPQSVAIGDFNGDNQPDLAVTNRYSDVSILLGNGSGSFSTATTFGAGSFPTSIANGDFNGDNQLDLAVANYGGNVSILLGNGSGSFSTATTFGAGSFPISVAIGDFSGDNQPDLAVANRYSDNVSILLGNGSGGFSTATTFGAGSFPASVAIGDFNGDNQPDLAVSNYNGDTVSILLGNGSGGFSTATTFGAGSFPASVASGDFNEDNQPDLAVANIDSDNISILLGNGSGGFSTATTFGAGSFPASVASGDFNGDNQPDLAVANIDSDNISILLGNGSGGFSAATNFNAGDGPVFVAIGDFNGDSQPDLAVANVYSNNVSILLNTAPKVSVTGTGTPQEQGSTPGTFTFSLNNTIASPLTLNFGVTGAASNPNDYSFSASDPNIISSTGTSITLAAGVTGASLTVIPVDDTLVEGNETINLTLFPAASFTDCFFINTAASTAMLTIQDNDSIPTAGVSAPLVDVMGVSDATEGGANGQFMFTLTGTTSTPITVSYSVGGAALLGTDYTLTPSVITFQPGTTSVTVDVAAINDAIPDPGETVSITVNNTTDYDQGSKTLAAINIIDNNTPTPPTPTPTPTPSTPTPTPTPTTSTTPTPTPETPTNLPSALDPDNRNCSGIIIPQIRTSATTETLPGSNGDDTLNGSNASEDIYGAQGNDYLFGNGGNDNIYGHQGNDFISGNEGNDLIKADQGDDTVFGGQDNDGIYGDTGADELVGDKGNDTIFGGQQNDFLSGESNNDFLMGDQGSDLIFGGKDNDILLGAEGGDTLSGDGGNDTLDGGVGNDSLIGGAGNDWLHGCQGVDTLTGSDGIDTFVIDPQSGRAVITDFTVGQDVIGLDGIGVTSVETFSDSQGLGIRLIGGGATLAVLNGVSGISNTDFTLI